MSKNLFSEKRHYLILLANIAIVAFIFPYLIAYKNAHIRVHDNLDSNLVWHTVLIESGHIFASNDTIIEPFMGGIPRRSFPSEFSVTVLWFWLLRPLDAYILERAIQAFVGFWGLYLLLKQHIIPGNYAGIQTGVALAFSFLPFWPFGGLSVAGQPLLLYVFLNLRKGDKKHINWIIIALYPFYASLVLSGFVFIILLVVIVIYDFIRDKRLRWRMIIGIGLLCCAFMVTHYRLVLSVLTESSYVSHRTEMALAGKNTFDDSIENIRFILRYGHNHAQSSHDLIILPSLIIGCFLILRFDEFRKKYLFSLMLLIITTLIYGFWQWDQLAFLVKPVFSIFPLNLGRGHFLHPMLWSILFAISLLLIKSYFNFGRYVVYAFIFLQCAYVFFQHELLTNYATPSFGAFYAEEQFAEIKSFIGEPTEEYRVISVGLHPSIAQYNGFYTLDGYMADYPLEYKEQFRRIIAGELVKNPEIQTYYDDWGSRVYVFVDQLGKESDSFLNYRDNNVRLEQLALDLRAFKAMGGKYIISAVEIDTEKNPQYGLMHVFKDSTSAWDIYLYEIAWEQLP